MTMTSSSHTEQPILKYRGNGATLDFLTFFLSTPMDREYFGETVRISHLVRPGERWVENATIMPLFTSPGADTIIYGHGHDSDSRFFGVRQESELGFHVLRLDPRQIMVSYGTEAINGMRDTIERILETLQVQQYVG